MFTRTPAKHYNIIYTSDSTTCVIALMDSEASTATYRDVEELTWLRLVLERFPYQTKQIMTAVASGRLSHHRTPEGI